MVATVSSMLDTYLLIQQQHVNGLAIKLSFQNIKVKVEGENQSKNK